MLRHTHTRTMLYKIALITFFGIMALGMVITLAPLPSFDSLQTQQNVVAQIGGQNITTEELDKNVRDRLQTGTGGKFIPQMAAVYARPILDGMILRRALVMQAKKLGLQVTDQEVLKSVQAVPAFYPDGKFVGDAQFQMMTGMTVSQFLEETREDLLVQKVRSLVTDGVRVTPAEVREQFVQSNAKARIEYVVFDPSKFMSSVEITPKALEDDYKNNTSQYQLPEERQVRYVLITPDILRSQVKVTEQDLKKYYSAHLSDYRVKDRVHVERILFKTTGKTPAEIATLEKTAQDVLQQIKAGKDFAALAEKYSEDASASKGGDVGWLQRGQTEKVFEDTAFSLKPGQVSGLIKTDYGIDIIKVLDKQTAHLESFEEVKDQIRAELEKQKLADAEQNFANNLGQQLQSNPKQFDALAKKAGLEVKETPLFRYRQVIPDFGNSESFANLSFQLRPGEVGQPFSIPKGTAIIQLEKVVPPHVQPLEEVRALVAEDYRAAQSKVLAHQKAEAFAAKAKSGDFKAVARSMGLTVKESKDFTEQGSVEGLGPAGPFASAFKLDPGKTSDVVSVSGNDVVFSVISHTPPDESAFASQKEAITSQLLQQKRQLVFELYSQDLKQRMLKSGELKINETTLKQLLQSYQRQSS
jgi:peptidyl-prolyl cis-trans isomerase D